MTRFLMGGVLVAILMSAGSTMANARPWKPQAQQLITDYSQIIDQRPGGEMVVLFWIVPQTVQNSPTVTALLEKYVMIGAVHGHVGVGGVLSYEPIDTMSATDADGKALILLQGDTMPPGVVGGIAGISAMMKQNLGQLGQGMHFFAFEAGNVHACAPGKLSIPLAGETYSYETPFPGCPKP